MIAAADPVTYRPAPDEFYTLGLSIRETEQCLIVRIARNVDSETGLKQPALAVLRGGDRQALFEWVREHDPEWAKLRKRYDNRGEVIQQALAEIASLLTQLDAEPVLPVRRVASRLPDIEVA